MYTIDAQSKSGAGRTESAVVCVTYAGNGPNRAGAQITPCSVHAAAYAPCTEPLSSCRHQAHLGRTHPHPDPGPLIAPISVQGVPAPVPTVSRRHCRPAKKKIKLMPPRDRRIFYLAVVNNTPQYSTGTALVSRENIYICVARAGAFALRVCITSLPQCCPHKPLPVHLAATESPC